MEAYTNGLDWRDGWKVGKHSTVTAGITWQHTSLDTEQNLLDAHNFAKNYSQGISNLSGYVTTKTRYGKLSLQSTSLFNHNTRFDNEYVYRDSLEYRPDDRLTFYGSLQRIYSVPTLDELYYNNYSQDSDGAWKIRGNEHLQPETGFKWNGGIRYRLNSHSTLGANAFVSHINNPIVWYREAGTWTPKNLESQNKDGIQVTWEDQFSRNTASPPPTPGPVRTPPTAAASIPNTPMKWRPIPSRRPSPTGTNGGPTACCSRPPGAGTKDGTPAMPSPWTPMSITDSTSTGAPG